MALAGVTQGSREPRSKQGPPPSFPRTREPRAKQSTPLPVFCGITDGLSLIHSETKSVYVPLSPPAAMKYFPEVVGVNLTRL